SPVLHATRCGCTAPCKEQAGNREPSLRAPFLQPRVSPSLGQNASSSLALMLRSRAAQASSRNARTLACDARRLEACGRSQSLVLILRDARTRVRIAGTIAHARSSG